jgi:hypothetical protein
MGEMHIVYREKLVAPVTDTITVSHTIGESLIGPDGRGMGECR